jgi:hypothetical protein
MQQHVRAQLDCRTAPIKRAKASGRASHASLRRGTHRNDARRTLLHRFSPYCA